MDTNMACRAITELRIRHIVGGRLQSHAIGLPAKIAGAVVALQADGENDRTFQESSVH